MPKADIDLSVRTLTDLFGKIWRQEKIPMDWSKGVIIKLLKKRDLKNFDNWRGIMLLSIQSKVLCKVILNRIDKQIDTKPNHIIANDVKSFTYCYYVWCVTLILCNPRVVYAV